MKIAVRIDRLIQNGNLKAIASVSLDGMFVVKGLKVMDSKKGLFVSMPQEIVPGKDGQKQYSNTFFPLTNSAKNQLETAVLDAYKLRMDPNYVPRQSQSHSRYPQQGQHQQKYYGGNNRQPYPEPGFRELGTGSGDYPEFLGGSDEILPLGM